METTIVIIFNAFIDIFFLCDIIVTSRTTYLDEKTEEEIL